LTTETKKAYITTALVWAAMIMKGMISFQIYRQKCRDSNKDF